jgi:hypothetical protein
MCACNVSSTVLPHVETSGGGAQPLRPLACEDGSRKADYLPLVGLALDSKTHQILFQAKHAIHDDIFFFHVDVCVVADLTNILPPVD